MIGSTRTTFLRYEKQRDYREWLGKSSKCEKSMGTEDNKSNLEGKPLYNFAYVQCSFRIYTRWWYKKAGKLWRCACSLFGWSICARRGKQSKQSSLRQCFSHNLLLSYLYSGKFRKTEKIYLKNLLRLMQVNCKWSKGFLNAASVIKIHHAYWSINGENPGKVTSFTGPIYERFFSFLLLYFFIQLFSDILYQTDVSNPTCSWGNG